MMKLRDCQRLLTRSICWCMPGMLWAISLISLATVHAQQSDPYRAELLPIRPILTKNHDSIDSPSPTPPVSPVSPPPRLAIPTISVSSTGSQILQEKNSSEALPNPRPSAGQGALPNTVADEGIVRMLKPLVVEPQNRELLIQRYPNGQVMIEREVALDPQGNYLNDGSWKMSDLDQQLMGSGRFGKGQMIGLWRRTHLEQDHPWLSSAEFRGFRSPFHSSAEFVDGKLHGIWLIKDDQERKVVELTYRDGRRHGSGTWWHPNGEMRRQLAFQNDLLHGVWQEWNSEKRLLTENWFVEGQRIDKQISNFAADRPESEVSFLEPKLTLAGEDDWWNARLAAYQPTGERIQTGPIKAWYDNGQRHMAGYYKDGERHGEFAWWHDNGHRKLIATYENGKQIGKWVWWHENGIKAAEGTYDNDRAIGAWTAWNNVGEITQQRDLGAARESLARPDYDSSQPGEIEELPPQLNQGNLDAPIAPSFEQLELPPPLSEQETKKPTETEESPPPPRPATNPLPDGTTTDGTTTDGTTTDGTTTDGTTTPPVGNASESEKNETPRTEDSQELI